MAGQPLKAWRLRRLPVCASTERELDRWLLQLQPDPDLHASGLAVVARNQRHGHGQHGRPWLSAPGGLWLSAAFDWPGGAVGGAPLTLAAAVGLALQLEQLGLRPQIKWPNDLLVDGRKLGGILAGLRLAGGRVRWARVGLGLNGVNRVPVGAIAVGEAMQHLGRPDGTIRRFHPRATPQALLPRALAALGWAQAHSTQPELVLALAEARLHRPAAGHRHGGRVWQVDGLDAGGGLRLQDRGEQLVLTRAGLSPAARF